MLMFIMFSKVVRLILWGLFYAIVWMLKEYFTSKNNSAINYSSSGCYKPVPFMFRTQIKIFYGESQELSDSFCVDFLSA